MIKFYDSNIVSILPASLAEKEKTQALGYALQRATQRLLEHCSYISVYAAIDLASEQVLDLLAAELNTQYYDEQLSLEAKRKLVKYTMIWYMSAGTPAAVEELVSIVFGSGFVQEWWEYGDKPYYFKVITDALLTPEMIEKFSSMIRRVKNTRSWLKTIEVHRNVNTKMYVTAGAVSVPKTVIDNSYEIQRKVHGSEYAAVALIPTSATVIDSCYKTQIIVNGSAHTIAAVVPYAKTIIREVK